MHLKQSNIIAFSFFSAFFILIFFFEYLSACKNTSSHKNTLTIADSSVQKGKALAAMYCAGCHVQPDVNLLTRKVWLEGVIPNMGPHVGIFRYKGADYPSYRFDRLVSKNYYPSEPIVTLAEWQNIIDYYTVTAPDTLYPVKRAVLPDDGAAFFEVLEPQKISTKPPVTCLVKMDSSKPNRKIITSDVLTKMVSVYNNQLVLEDTFNMGGPVTDFVFSKNKWIACNTGLLNPNNGKFGKISEVNINNAGKKTINSKPLFDSLMRPVQLLEADLNQDGKPDFVVCEFGHLNGALCWLENRGSNKFERHVLKYQPGALRVIANDYNHDGLTDIWVLFSQGNESLVLFTNKGGGKFDETELKRFQPQWGSSSFDLADMNNDGLVDIVYTCGDNADFSKILKPFHGVYVYLNQGNNQFTQAYFYPINGAFKVLARDFNADGQPDMAVIAFFADYVHTPNEGFIYFENKGKNQFSPHALSATNQGRWLTMDAGDMDGDGKPDIVLGNFSVAPTLLKSQTDWKQGAPFMVLRNSMHKFQ